MQKVVRTPSSLQRQREGAPGLTVISGHVAVGALTRQRKHVPANDEDETRHLRVALQR